MKADSGIIPGMGNNLAALRKAKGWTQEKAADAFGISVSGYRKLEYSTRGLKLDRIEQAASVYAVPPSQVFTDAHEINIVGHVSAGEEIFDFDDEAMGGGEPIEAPPDIGPGAVAVRIRGDSMYPDYDPDDVLVYDERYESDFDNFIGRRVIIGLHDGRRLIKRLRKGTAPGLYRLESSNPRVQDIEDAAVAWVAPIKWVRPRW